MTARADARRPSRAEVRRHNRAALLDAAAARFAQRGFRTTTIDEVAAAAGLTKGAVYSHFDSKHDLFAAAIARRYRERHGAFLGIMSDETLDPAERTRRAAVEFAGSVASGADWALLFSEAWAEMIRTPSFGADVRRLADEFRAAVARLIEDTLAAQGLAAPYPSERIAEMTIAAAHGFGIAHRLDPEHAPPDLFADFVSLFTSGLLTRCAPGSTSPGRN